MYGEAETPWCSLSSVKAQIGHAKAAAGAAGLIKAALALHHKVLPPTIKVTNPLREVTGGATPFYLTTEKRPWLPRGEAPRRAGVVAGAHLDVAVLEFAAIIEVAGLPQGLGGGTGAARADAHARRVEQVQQLFRGQARDGKIERGRQRAVERVVEHHARQRGAQAVGQPRATTSGSQRNAFRRFAPRLRTSSLVNR